MFAPSRQPDRDNPGLADIFTAMPVAALLIAPDNRIVNANARAESLFNMAKSAIIGGDVAHMVRIVDMAPRSEFCGTDKLLSAYDIHVDAGRAAGMQVALMISPIADHEGWRVGAILCHRQAQKIDHRRVTNGKRLDIGRASWMDNVCKKELL